MESLNLLKSCINVKHYYFEVFRERKAKDTVPASFVSEMTTCPQRMINKLINRLNFHFGDTHKMPYDHKNEYFNIFLFIKDLKKVDQI